MQEKYWDPKPNKIMNSGKQHYIKEKVEPEGDAVAVGSPIDSPVT